MKQYYKSIYFTDYPSNKSKSKSFTLAFSEKESNLYNAVKDFSNEEVRETIGISSYKQLELFAEKEERSVNQVIKRLIKNNIYKITRIEKKDITFAGSKTIPFQRWYPYIEGYSPDFVKSLIKNYGIVDKIIYDPFAGTGTTIFAADDENLRTVYSEINPLLQFLIQTKIEVLKSNETIRIKLAEELNNINKTLFKSLDGYVLNNNLKESYNTIFSDSIYFPPKTLEQILKLRTFVDNLKLKNELLANTFTVAILSCLIPISYLKKAGDVRFKTQEELVKELKNFEDILPQKISEIAKDILDMKYFLKSIPEFILSNSKNIGRIKELKIGAIITSPPYLNGTNYFRNTKLELWFLRYLQYDNDLRYFRDQALTCGINDVKKENSFTNGFDIISKSIILKDTLIELNKKSYDSRIPRMIISYFQEMYQIFLDLRKYLTNNAKILIDIGDSIFCNVHIKTDLILIELLKKVDYQLIEHIILRKRRSRNNEILTQSLMVFDYAQTNKKEIFSKNNIYWKKDWINFKSKLPHHKEPFSKRNWGHPYHSLCSYQGKLKPSIAHHLISTFVPENGSILDPFSGVGTIPFEAALTGRLSFGIDISLPAYFISNAKLSIPIREEIFTYINKLDNFINIQSCTNEELEEAMNFGFNKTISEYYEESTLKEILKARRFFKNNLPKNSSEMLVIASLLHILHGNRPYALSRRSHPIVPYSPSGEYIYKNLIKNLTDKINRVINKELPLIFKPGKTFNQDSTTIWPQEINNLDAIITSPPFFDSTRFYLANWIRIWFSGWSEKDFKYQPNSYIEEKQKKSFIIYESIFRQAKERLKKDGVCVFHLGKSVKCNMAVELQKICKRWFKTADLFTENVEHCESHGIRDKGTVTSHQYLVLT